MASLIDIEGVGEAHAAKLKAAGLQTTADLLAKAGTAAGRDALAAETGISGKAILDFVNRADLDRIHGVGSEYADLLEAVGVDTVVELATRVPANLHAAIAAHHDKSPSTRRVPSLAQIEAFVAEAKTLPRLVHH